MDNFNPYRCQESATGHQAALVVDSPHSGAFLPPDMHWQGDLRLLLANEDVGVDTLFADVPLLGGALLTAHVSRHYIDLNRGLDDLDPNLVAGVRPAATGYETGGLIRPLPGLRRARLTQAELEKRIEGVWRPYHMRLSHLLRQRREQHGAVWHLNAHSMPADTRTQAGKLVDVVLGDRHGTTAAPEFAAVVSELCRKEGLSVAHNDPYAGVECVKRHGRPQQGQHSLQFEIGRQLFYNEETFRFLPQMESFRITLNRILRGVISYTASATRSRTLFAAE